MSNWKQPSQAGLVELSFLTSTSAFDFRLFRIEKNCWLLVKVTGRFGNFRTDPGKRIDESEIEDRRFPST